MKTGPAENNPKAYHFQLAACLVLSLGIRLVLAPMRGHVFDITQFKVWVQAIHQNGLLAVYGTSSANYPPLSLLPLAAVGGVYSFISQNFDPATTGLTVLIKLPAILADLLAVGVIAHLVKRRFGPRAALVCAAAYGLNPAVWYTSAWWGQLEALYALPMLLAIAALEREKPARAWAWLAAGVLFKPQAAAIAPVLIVASWLQGRWTALSRGALAAASVLILVLLPWALAGQLSRLFGSAAATVGHKGFLTMNAHNFWFLLSGGAGSFAARENHPVLDTQQLLGPLTGWQIGLVLLVAWVLIVCWLLYKQRGIFSVRQGYSLAAAALAAGFFMLPAEAHERYLFPFFILLAPLLPASKPLRWLYLVFSLTYTLNLLWVDPAFPLPYFSEHLAWGMPISAINLAAFIVMAVYMAGAGKGSLCSCTNSVN